MKRKLLAALLAALLTFTLAACNTGVNVPVTQTGSDDFQKNMHQTNRYNFIETDTGSRSASGMSRMVTYTSISPAETSGEATLRAGRR